MRALPLLFLFAGCELFNTVPTQTQELDQSPLPANRPLDILFVVDNSGSMLDEQDALARAFFNDECPIQDLNNVPQQLLNPEPGLLEQLSTVCGFAQILAAYDRDFQVGVITTDVNACDAILDFQLEETGRVRKPQRGCLQPAPATGDRVLKRSDPLVATKFVDVLQDIGTIGSPVERGLDATTAFLESDVADESCAGDRDLLIRDDAQLLIIYLSDEDDCSHVDGDERFPNRSDICGEDPDFLARMQPYQCYENAASLPPVTEYLDRIRALKSDVMVGVVGGVVVDGDTLVSAGCRPSENGPDTLCRETGGLSNFNGPGQVCEASDELACCTADAAHRYLSFTEENNGANGGSICQQDFVRPLIAILQSTENDG